MLPVLWSPHTSGDPPSLPQLANLRHPACCDYEKGKIVDTVERMYVSARYYVVVKIESISWHDVGRTATV